MMKKEHLGRDFDSFLEAEGILDEANAVAAKRFIAWQIEQKIKFQDLTETAMASKINKS